MNFFTEFLQHLKDGEHINIAISKREEGKLVVSVAPVAVESDKTKIRPLLLRGTAAEIDEGFFNAFDALRKPLEDKGLVTNVEAVNADAAEEAEESAEKETKAAATPAAKKAEGKGGSKKKKEEAPAPAAAADKGGAEIAEAIKKADAHVEKKEFFEAITVLSTLQEKKYPGDPFLGKKLNEVRMAKAKHELDSDDEGEKVTIPAKPKATAPVPTPAPMQAGPGNGEMEEEEEQEEPAEETFDEDDF